MPELPEVETIRRQIQSKIEQVAISNIEIYETRLRFPLPDSFIKTMQGQTISTVSRHGKYLQFFLSNGDLCLLHLGMSGRLLWSGLDARYFTHLVFRIRFANGQELIYADPRRFGFVMLNDKARLQISKLGVDALSAQFNIRHWQERWSNAHRKIKDFLMDQTRVAGLGNIYINEALFRARIHPRKKVSELTSDEAVHLLREIKAVLKEAIRFQGSSISDFLDTHGKKGRFQERFTVYSRTGLPCPKCARPVERQKDSGRSFFYCPHCQKL